MNKLFTLQVLEELKKTIRQCLEDTITFMFNFDISLCDSPKEAKDKEPVCASVILSSAATRALLYVTIPNPVANELALVIGAGDLPKDQMLQDIACELANIVAHAIQGYFDRLPSAVSFDVGLPQKGLVSPHLPSEDAGILKLPTPADGVDPICLDFVFSKSA
ncbi:MAG: hypothetical protein P4M13_00735 [Alphaproteobacteria bacterium]|nr:hypothetical protein [Alphaproteobacteria bacterium]